MKTKPTYFSSLVFMLLLEASIQIYALDYTISFTASGVITSVGAVQVQNLTKGKTVTVLDGHSLNLTDVPMAIEEFDANNKDIRISQNPDNGKSTLTFYASQAGSVQVAFYDLDGRKVAGQTIHLEMGDNSFELSMPAGIYVLRISGAGYAYSAKLPSQASVGSKVEIKFLGNKQTESSAPLKSKVPSIASTTMSYTIGDQLLYTAHMDGYIASFPDMPTGSKTINFVFDPVPSTAIPAGTFTMGSPLTEFARVSDEIQHQVTLSAFRMSKYEITNAQYAAFLNAKSIGSNGLYAAGGYPTQPLIYTYSIGLAFGLYYKGSQWVPVAGKESNPIINVTWYGSMEFANYVGGTLPSEAQWEYACRAGTITPFNTGDFLNNLQANYMWTYPYNGGINTETIYPFRTQSVGTYLPNAFGLYDMHGNVDEWCSDWYGTYPTTAQTNPTGATIGTSHVYRGGNWYCRAMNCRSAIRSKADPNIYWEVLGFRVVFAP